MATDTWYAWSPIVVGDDDGKLVTINPGDSVTPAKLRTDEAGFQAYLESGAVRPYAYPDMPDTANQMAPLEYLREERLKGVTEEEERLTILTDPLLMAASQGPVGGMAELPEGVEEGTGPSKEATARK